MDNIKKHIKEKVETELPFLRKIEIDQCSSLGSDFITNYLLPYLFYINTIDKNFRIIPVYLRRTEDIIQLPLFYSLGIFKLYADFYLNLKKFENKSFLNDELGVIDTGGNVCKIERVNYISKDILIRSGLGVKEIIEFDSYDFFDIERKNRATNYEKTIKLFDEIESFKKSLSISQNPLELIGKMSDLDFQTKNSFNGALFFTHNPRLIKSEDFKDFKINDNSFLNTIPTSRLELNDEGLDYIHLADKRNQRGKLINNLKEFIIFSRFENYKGFFKVKEEKTWLNTIVFDLTNDISDLDNVLEVIQEKYEEKLDGQNLKDIYLIFRETDLNSYYKIQSSGIVNTPVLLNYSQKCSFIKDASKIKNTEVLELNKNDFTKEFNVLISSIKEFCKEVHLIDLYRDLISPTYEVIHRYNSFYNPENLLNQLKSLKKNLLDLQKNTLYDNRHIDKFNLCFEAISTISKNLNNHKLNCIIDSIDSEESLHLAIISYNENKIDEEYCLSFFESNDVDLINPKDIKNPLKLIEEYDKIFIVNSNQKLSLSIILNPTFNEIKLVFTENELNYHQKLETSQIINKIANDNALINVLNLDFTPIAVKEDKNIPKETEEDSSQSYEFDMNSFINSVIKDNKTNTIYTYSQTRPLNSIILVFKDGTSITVPDTKRFYIHKEDIASLKECRVQAKELQENDLVFILNHDSEKFENMIWEIAKDYPEIERILELDLLWRNNINDYLLGHDLTCQDLSKIFEKSGLYIGGQAIYTWINEEVYQPREINQLIPILANLQIINPTNIEKIISSVKKVKQLKTRLPHELRKVHIADLNDLEYTSNFVFHELIEKMYQFMDIKTITLIIK